MLKAFDPLVLHLSESLLGRRERQPTLSFGQSLDGTRDVLLLGSTELTDLLAIVPAARALRKRFRLARVHVLAVGPSAEVLSARSEIFGVVPWIRPEVSMLSRDFVRAVRAMRAQPFDLAIALDGGESRLSRVAAALAGAKLRVGVHPEGRDPTLNLVVAAAPPRGYAPVQSLEFLSFLGIPREELAPTWEVPEADFLYATRLLELRRRGREGWLLGVDPGPGRAGVRPAPEKLAWLVDRLVESRGAIPLILSSEEDGSYAEQFRIHLKSRPLEVAIRGFRDILSFVRCCDLFLSGNTSLFHFAVAVGAPTVGLFPPAEEERWCPPETARCRLLRWHAGERVGEPRFLEFVDRVRGSRVLEELPAVLTLPEEEIAASSAPAPELASEPEIGPQAPLEAETADRARSAGA